MAISSLTSAPGSSSISLCGARRVTISSTRSSPSCHRASWASSRCPTWGGLKAPPRTPIRATSLLPDLPAAVDDVLGRRQLAQPDRAAGMQLLGRVAYLPPHPELIAVRESRRRIDIDSGRIHPVRELLPDLLRAGHDR